MSEDFVPLGRQTDAEIAQKLRDIGDEAGAKAYEAYVESLNSAEEGFINLAEVEDSFVLPYNAIVFRISPYEGL